MDRLDESIKEEADGIHNSLGELTVFLNGDLWGLCQWIVSLDDVVHVIHTAQSHHFNSQLCFRWMFVFLWFSSSICCALGPPKTALECTVSQWIYTNQTILLHMYWDNTQCNVAEVVNTYCTLCTAIVENITEVRPEACVDAGQQGVVQWLLKRIRVRCSCHILPY